MTKARQESLERQHLELEMKIETEAKRPQPDEDLLHELKKRKLKLKEEMSQLRRN
ncbi:MAG: DUF465 domain-containing protein [Parvibaculales bacterium]